MQLYSRPRKHGWLLKVGEMSAGTGTVLQAPCLSSLQTMSATEETSRSSKALTTTSFSRVLKKLAWVTNKGVVTGLRKQPVY